VSLITRDSRNATQAGAPALKIQRRLLLSDGEASGAGVEWHHLAGDCLGFYPKSHEEVARVAALIDRCTARELDKKNNALGIKSKAAAWRYIEAQREKHLGSEDKGLGAVRIKYGKFGPFVPAFGDPDAVYFFQSLEEKNSITKFLKI